MNERIKCLRKALGLTQSEFGERLNLSSNYISLVESGRNPVSDKLIFNILKTYHANESWLRTGEGEMFEPIEREDEIARIADQMLHEVEPSIRNGMHRIVADMTEEELKLFFDCAKRLVDDMDE